MPGFLPTTVLELEIKDKLETRPSVKNTKHSHFRTATLTFLKHKLNCFHIDPTGSMSVVD